MLLALGNLLSVWLTSTVEIDIPADGRSLLGPKVLLAAVVYALVLAVPFVPGAEIGLAMMMMAGARVALLVYLSTIAGLSISFLFGRFLPLQVLTNCFRLLGFRKAQALLLTIEPLQPTERLQFLMSTAPNRLIPFLLRHRYLALGIVLNVPGNSLIGGGGGIVLLAGISRLYSIPAFLLTITIAVAPIPLLVMFFGVHFFSD
uniref:hypothetical protein n=1 Tax=Pararhizobium sp. IMCC3301 TaxID=3067904 RepID=UPI002740BD57|nr:hypothetical protein [Pararhizobium sp. IMCC3301]